MGIPVAAIMYVGSLAQAIDLSGFADILFLFIGLGQVALPIAVSLIVLLVILDIIGIDVLGLVRTLRGNA